MLSLVDCLGRLPTHAPPCRPILRLLAAARRPATYGNSFSRLQQPATSPGWQLARHSTLGTASSVPQAAEDFYAGSAVTFGGLGLSAEVCAALQQAGYPRPAHAQELAVPEIVAGRDAVLAAETGSGKTLAYLAPLVERALRSRRQVSAAAAGAAAEAAPRRRRGTATLVLCPNAALCEQVVAAAQALRDPASGAPLAAAAVVSSQQPPPLSLPDIVVTTPGALVSLMDNGGTAYGYEWTRDGLPGWARCVVFDEADLLLSGGYGAQMRIIWDALRAGDRLHAARRICLQVGLTEDEFYDLPRHLKQAAKLGGAQGLLDAGFRPRRPPPGPGSSGSSSSEDSSSEGGVAPASAQQQQPEGAATASAGAAAGAAAAAGHAASGVALNVVEDEGHPEVGVYGASWRRQYVFVAATMPAEGERSVGAEIAARFPEAAWLAGRQLHQSKRAVEHVWRRVADAQERARVLQEVVSSDEGLQAGRGRMLVFARDVASADATADALERGSGGSSSSRPGKDPSSNRGYVEDADSDPSSYWDDLLEGSPEGSGSSSSSGDSNSGGGSSTGTGSSSSSTKGPPVLRYHKGVPAAARAAALARMCGEEGLVMVCTDAAARGLDVPDVSHVVQADFAQSAVDFLHRVGRTARAGKVGRVTSLFTPQAEPLVQAIRDNIAAGQPVEGAFSRKRSFRKKMKKYGEYVPRGQEGPSEPRQVRRDERAARGEQRRSRQW